MAAASNHDPYYTRLTIFISYDFLAKLILTVCIHITAADDYGVNYHPPYINIKLTLYVCFALVGPVM